MSRPFLFRATALVAGLLVGCVVAEVGLRMAGPRFSPWASKRLLTHADRPVFYHCYPSNPHGEFRELPEVRGRQWLLAELRAKPVRLPLAWRIDTPWCVEYQTTEFKLRAPPADREPPAADAVRLAVVGDSFTFGEGVPVELCLPVRLQTELGPAFDLINVGRPGANTATELKLAKLARQAFDCDKILVVFTANDVELSGELSARQDYINDLINIRATRQEVRDHGVWYAGRSQLVDLVVAKWAVQSIGEETIRWYLDSYDPRQNRENLVRFTEHLRELASLEGCQVALVLYPLLEGLDDQYPLAAVHEYVDREAKAVGLPVLDLTPAFANLSPEDLWVHALDHHPNGTGHKIAAETIAEWLRNSHPEFLSR